MANQSAKTLKEFHFTDEPVLVSIAMIAYNVDPFIAEGIESILAQKVNFRVELIIGEDCSTDKTRDIALEYQKRFPDIIKVLEREENMGLTPNFVDTINTCIGDWVAICDGDDYWTDDLKLVRQMDFLLSNPAYTGAAHQSHKIYTNQLQATEIFGEEIDMDYKFADMQSHRKFHTSSFIFNRSIWVKYGGIPKDISSNERALFPLIAMEGTIRYFKESMCVYRITGSGLTTRVDYKELITDLKMIPWLKGINPKLNLSHFRAFLHQCVYNYGTKAVPLKPLLKYYLAFVWFSFGYFPNNLGDLRWGTVFFFRKFKRLF